VHLNNLNDPVLNVLIVSVQEKIQVWANIWFSDCHSKATASIWNTDLLTHWAVHWIQHFNTATTTAMNFETYCFYKKNERINLPKKSGPNIFSHTHYKKLIRHNTRGCWYVLSPTRKETSYNDQTRDLFNTLPTKLNTLLRPLLKLLQATQKN